MVLSVILLSYLTTSCSMLKLNNQPRTVSYELTCSARPENRYSDLNHGVYLMVSSEVQNSNIYDPSELNSKSKKAISYLTFDFIPSVKEFVTSSLTTYLRSSGISVGRDSESDYALKVRVKEFKVVDGVSSARATAILDYTLSNPDNEVILQQTARGRYTMSPGQSMADALDKAYSRALADMDWDGIASALKVHKRADQEATRKVVGDGNTALEHTVIRWYIASSPAGADVSWRVVSSTPEVKNTNSTYVGTTPYETTESFDIRGLKFENSGNVQIEVTCEKAGYMPQKKRFNLRQAIEQKEISAKFNLVKDE